MNLYKELLLEIIKNSNNNYDDNYDYYRFGKQLPKSFKAKIRDYVTENLKKRNFVTINTKESSNAISALNAFDPYQKILQSLYETLGDDSSKKLLIKILAYRILGHKKIKFFDTKQYWHSLKAIENITDFQDIIPVKFMNWTLKRIDLNKINIPITIYFTPPGAHKDFILRQYEYNNKELSIKANPGDYVIDAGGCWGDTALYFANEVGKNGKVFSLEFIPSNISIFKRNVEMNMELNKQILLVENPVWENSDVDIYYTDNGPGSRVMMEKEGKYDGMVKSLSIDDLIDNYKVPKIDFIKMDIEGAEPYALKGAIETIKKYKPKLAVAIYHSIDDFANIPNYLISLNLGYKFFLGHFSLHSEETILFAVAND